MSETLTIIITAITTALCTGVVLVFVNWLNNKWQDNKREQLAGQDKKTDIKVLVERIDNLITTITKLENNFNKHRHTESGQVLVMGDSPLHLTDVGKEHFEKSGTKAYLQKHLLEWYADFEDINTNYEIQDKAREYMEAHYKESTDADFKKIKAYFFNEGILPEQTLLMMSVALRDMICDKKGIVIQKEKEKQPA